MATLKRPHHVRPNTRRNYERLGIMYNQRVKRSQRTLYQSAFSLDQVENVDRILSVVKNRASEPVPPGFDKLRFMQPTPPPKSVSHG